MISGGMSLGAGMKFRNPFRPNTRNIRPNKIRTMAVTMRPADFFSRSGVSTVCDAVSVMGFLSMSRSCLYLLIVFVFSMVRRRWRLGGRVSLPVHLLAPALGAARAVQERQSGVGHLRCDAHFVMCHVRQYRQVILRHVLALPAGILQSGAEQLVELHFVLRPKHVAVAVNEHYRHGQSPDVCRPVVRLAHVCAH